MSKYDHLTHDELVRLLEARDRRDATRFGLVWEANEIDRDNAVNADFVYTVILYREGGGRWMTVGYDEKAHKARIVHEFRISDASGF